MEQMEQMSPETQPRMNEWLAKLASSEPAPGGGGAAAMTGAMAAGLVAMSAALTANKKKYEACKDEMETCFAKARALSEKLYGYIEGDAKAYLALNEAYKRPKDTPGYREDMDRLLEQAALVPLSILLAQLELVPLLETLSLHGSKLMQSDVGCAASLCMSAAETASLNVLVNAKYISALQTGKALTEKALLFARLVKERCAPILEKTKGELS